MHKEKRRLNKTAVFFLLHSFVYFKCISTNVNNVKCKGNGKFDCNNDKETVLIRLYLWHCSFHHHQMRHTMRFFSVLTKMCSILLRFKCAAPHCVWKLISSKVGILSIYILTKPVKKKMCHPNRIEMKVMCASTWSTLYSQSLSSVTLDAF